MEAIEKRILEMFPPEIESYGNYDEQEYIEILDAVKDLEWFNSKLSYYSWSAFLYFGCLKFNRWAVPSPSVFKLETSNIFRRFLETLIYVLGESSNNTKVLVLQDIKSEIFKQNDSLPVELVNRHEIGMILNKIAAIEPPVSSSKLEEFLREKEKVLKIISGLLNGSIRTKVRTDLPYIIHRSSLSIRSSWNGITVNSKFTPTFFQSESLATSNIPIQPISPSRWQAGTTKVELEFKALIDYDVWTPSLLELSSESLPFDGWPQGFTVAFQVIDDLVWKIRMEYGGEAQWIPAPRDIGASKFEILLDGQQVEWKLRDSPAAFMQGFPKSEEVLELELGQLKPIPWYKKCKVLAVMYLEIGETNEALFWLNAGIEALFQSRFKEIDLANSKRNLEGELNSPNAFWIDAEEVVAKQLPELAGQIKWPKSESHVSLYKKLKYLHKLVKMKTSVKELNTQYNKISKYRNSLVHGVIDERLPASVVKEALGSFDWIEENFVLAEHDSCA